MPTVTDREVELYAQHFNILQKWNTQIALVSRKSIGESFSPHYADSLFTADFLAKHRGALPVFDLGTGAGFPGIIFAIRYPNCSITLFEKSLKKKTFLMAAIEELQLSNVTLEGDLGTSPRKGIFFARAVLPRPELLPWLSPILKPGSLLVSNLGSTPRPGEEKIASFRIVQESSYELPLGNGTRRLELLERVPRGT